ncbi:MAG: S41 family peptidase [Phycisphaerales bacterium]|nr:S41 family peptidase [Phycisphaerales bacterium]
MNKRIIAPVLLGLILGTVLVQLPFAIADRSADYRWSNPILDVWYIVNQSYVEQPDADAMRDAAIDGMLEELGDRYTEYVPRRDIADFDKNLRGTFVGIGASVRITDGWPVIVTPLDDSPALRAGVMTGDRVIEIAGQSTHELTIDETVDLLSGEPGSQVVIRVWRETGDELDITITRARIFTPTVKGFYRVGERWEYMLSPESRIAYIRIAQFTQATTDDMQRILTELHDTTQGVVLDLRSNPGGLLQSAVRIADMFLDEGKTIVSSEGRARPRQEYVSSAKGTIIGEEIPLIVLVDAGSASASEVLAGALSDHGRAIILGTRSFGKGTVQSVVPLESGEGQLKITEAYYYLPSGRKVHRTDRSTEWGVDPTEGFYVSMTRREITEMRLRAYDVDIIRAEGDGDAPAARADPQWIRDELKDRQLAAAVEALGIYLGTGEWQPTGRVMDAAGLDLVELQNLQTQRDRFLRELTRLDRRAAALIDSATDADQTQAERDLIPDDVTLTGGQLTIRDAEGNEIAVLAIVGEDLERWLIDADVERLDAADDGGS